MLATAGDDGYVNLWDTYLEDRGREEMARLVECLSEQRLEGGVPVRVARDDERCRVTAHRVPELEP